MTPLQAARIRLMIRVISTRIQSGETLEDALVAYPLLTDAERTEITAQITADAQ